MLTGHPLQAFPKHIPARQAYKKNRHSELSIHAFPKHMFSHKIHNMPTGTSDTNASNITD